MSKGQKTMPTKTHQKMREQVQCGEALLSEKRPGWESCIQVDRLDMSSGRACILGQLFDGDFGKGVHALFGFDWSGGLPVTDEEYHLVADHGFVTSIDYYQLELIWKEVLQQKKVHA